MPIAKRVPLQQERVILELARSGSVSYPASDSSQIYAKLRLQDQPEQEVFFALKLLRRAGLVSRTTKNSHQRYVTGTYTQKMTGKKIERTSKDRTVTLRLDDELQQFCASLWMLIHVRLVLARYSVYPSIAK